MYSGKRTQKHARVWVLLGVVGGSKSKSKLGSSVRTCVIFATKSKIMPNLWKRKEWVSVSTLLTFELFNKNHILVLGGGGGGGYAHY